MVQLKKILWVYFEGELQLLLPTKTEETRVDQKNLQNADLRKVLHYVNWELSFTYTNNL